MKGKVAVVTGANSGIGKETAVALAAMGATTVLACRDQTKAAAAAAEVRQRAASDEVTVVSLDLANLASVRRAAATIADAYGRVDVLVNNAGGIWTHRATTAQGFEQTFGVNHLGPFYFTNLLRDLLVAGAPARVVNLSSAAHRLAVRGLRWNDLQHQRHYVGTLAYGESKLANLLFTRALAERFEPTVLTANAVHPGAVRSGFGRSGDAGGPVGLVLRAVAPLEISSEAGADTVIFLCVDASVTGKSGGYWYQRHQSPTSRAAGDDDAAHRLWSVSLQLLAEAGFPLE